MMIRHATAYAVQECKSKKWYKSQHPLYHNCSSNLLRFSSYDYTLSGYTLIHIFSFSSRFV